MLTTLGRGAVSGSGGCLPRLSSKRCLSNYHPKGVGHFEKGVPGGWGFNLKKDQLYGSLPLNSGTAEWRKRSLPLSMSSLAIHWPKAPNFWCTKMAVAQKIPEFQHGLRQVETWTTTCGLPLLLNFEPHPNGSDRACFPSDPVSGIQRHSGPGQVGIQGSPQAFQPEPSGSARISSSPSRGCLEFPRTLQRKLVGWKPLAISGASIPSLRRIPCFGL